MAGNLGTSGGEGGDSLPAGSADNALIDGSDQDAAGGGVDYDFFVFDALTDSESQQAAFVHQAQSGGEVDVSAIDGDSAMLVHAGEAGPVASPYDNPYKIELFANDNAKPAVMIDVDAEAMLQAAYFLL